MRQLDRSIELRWCLAALVMLSLSSGSAFAYSTYCAKPINPPQPPVTDPDPRCDPPCKCTNSPCYLGLGVYTSSATDLMVRTGAGSLISASRQYLSSQIADGPMGFGWMPSVVSRISYATYAFAAGVYQKRAYVLLPTGQRLMFVENANGTFTPPLGRYDTLVKTGGSPPAFDLTPQHTRTHLFFGGAGYLTSIQDDYQNIQNYTYFSTPTQVQQITDLSGSGRYMTISWGGDGRIATIGDSSGRAVEYGYSGDGELTSVTDAADRITSYAYATGRFGPILSLITDPWGRVVAEVSYESGTNRVQTYTEAGETYTLAYNYLGVPNQVGKNPASLPGFFYSYIYDSSSGLVTDYYNGVANEHTDYYQDGSVKEFVDRRAIHTYYTYDVNGNVSQVTRNKNLQNLNSIRFDYAYDPLFPAKVTSITPRNPADGSPNSDWLKWNYDYYQLGSSPSPPGALWKVRRNGSAGAIATYVYDALGRVTQFTPGAGGSTSYKYNALGDLITVTLPANDDAGTLRTISYGYDSLGRVTSVTDPLGKVTSYTYDALDRVMSVTLPTISTTPGTFTTTYTYANFDAVSQLLFTRVTDPNAVVTQQGYNEHGQLVKALDGQSHTTIENHKI